jgi:hypothetical protein
MYSTQWNSDQPRAQQDHHGAQHDRADDADHQHPLLELRRHREVGEDHQEDEDVVHRQTLLDEIAGEEFHRPGVGHGRAVILINSPPEQRIEGEAQGHPDQRPVQRLLHAHGVGALLLQYDEVDEQRHENGRSKKQPKPGRRDGVHGHSRKRG